MPPNVKRPKIYGASASKRRRLGSQSPRLLRRRVFRVRAFTTCWRSDLSQVGVEVAFARNGNLKPLLGLLLALLGHAGSKLGVGVLAGLSATLLADPLDLGPNRFPGRNTRLFPTVDPDIDSEIKGALLRGSPHGKRD